MGIRSMNGTVKVLASCGKTFLGERNFFRPILGSPFCQPTAIASMPCVVHLTDLRLDRALPPLRSSQDGLFRERSGFVAPVKHSGRLRYAKLRSLILSGHKRFSKLTSEHVGV
ncbi:hypothetical protein KC331_g37 [Hortaea werneckii]|nr:hypothetical protein KC331_g37 [Hortaea werneckii]